MNKTHHSNMVISGILVCILVITTVFAFTSTGTFAETKTTGNAESYSELKELLENSEIETINITKDFELDQSENTTHSGITLERSVTINGNNHTITGNQMGYLIDAKKDVDKKNTELKITNLTFKDFKNTGKNGKYATDSWGGVLRLGCNATITNCNFINNSTTIAEVTNSGITPSTVNRNYGKGGAIMHYKPDSASGNQDSEKNYNTLLTIKNCTFTGNSAAGEGGAICSLESVIIENSIFTNNESHREGGAIYINRSGTIKDCVFTGNQVYKPDSYKEGEDYYAPDSSKIPGKGGAVYFSGNKVKETVEYEKGRSISDCSFHNNKSETSGGAIYVSKDLVYNGINNFYENTPKEDNGLGLYLLIYGIVNTKLIEGEEGSSLVEVHGALKPASITNENTTLSVNAGKTESMDVKTDANPLPTFIAKMENGDNLPGWIKINKKTGKITASPDRTQKVGETTITVSASNGVASEGNQKPKAVTKNFTIKVLELAKYIVTLDENGGQKLPDNKVTVVDGEKYGKLPVPARKGYSFKGWYTQKSGGTVITENTNVTITKDQTLYARWSPDKYKVTFVGNKGKISKKAKVTKKKTYDQKFGKLPKAKRKGYKFKGWYTKKKGGKKITSKTKMTYTKNIKLYAQWKKK